MSAADGREYRVLWQREGLLRARKLYQTRKGAEEFIELLTGPNPSRDEWESELPPIIEGPILEQRKVGAWRSGS